MLKIKPPTMERRMPRRRVLALPRRRLMAAMKGETMDWWFAVCV